MEEKYKIIRGSDLQQQLRSIDVALDRIRKQAHSKITHAYIVPVGIWQRVDVLEPGTQVPCGMSAGTGKIGKVIAWAGHIEKAPGEKDATAILNITADWVTFGDIIKPGVKAHISGQGIEVSEGARFYVTSSRRIEDLWVCIVIEPKPYPISLELEVA